MFKNTNFLYIHLLFSSTKLLIPGTYPVHWPKNCSHGQRVKVDTSTYKSLKDSFVKSIAIPVIVTNIEEICNVEFYDKYEGYVISCFGYRFRFCLFDLVAACVHIRVRIRVCISCVRACVDVRVHAGVRPRVLVCARACVHGRNSE